MLSMKLQHMGFFRELPHGHPDAPSLKEVLHPEAGYDKEVVAAYLSKAPFIEFAPGLVRDILDSSGPIIGPLGIQTDGVWAWPSDLAYYVDRYNVALPPEFLAHLERQVYRLPTQEEIDRLDLDGPAID